MFSQLVSMGFQRSVAEAQTNNASGPLTIRFSSAPFFTNKQEVFVFLTEQIAYNFYNDWPYETGIKSGVRIISSVCSSTYYLFIHFLCPYVWNGKNEDLIYNF